jgi:hypothetical protein
MKSRQCTTRARSRIVLLMSLSILAPAMNSGWHWPDAESPSESPNGQAEPTAEKEEPRCVPPASLGTIEPPLSVHRAVIAVGRNEGDSGPDYVGQLLLDGREVRSGGLTHSAIDSFIAENVRYVLQRWPKAAQLVVVDPVAGIVSCPPPSPRGWNDLAPLFDQIILIFLGGPSGTE